MAHTGPLTKDVEEYVRAHLAEVFGQPFTKERLRLAPGGLHEFDAVSEDRSVIGSIKASGGRTSGGNHPSGKVTASIAELYFLSLVQAPRRLLILTTPEFVEIFNRTMKNKVANGIEVYPLVLPPDLQKVVTGVHDAARDEMTIPPVLDPDEQRTVEEDA